MKKTKKAVLLLLLVSVFMTVFSSFASAEDTDYLGKLAPKTYTINVYAGKRGTFDTSNVNKNVFSYEVGYNEIVSFNDALGDFDADGFYSNVIINNNETDSKYYAKGVRPAGFDNKDENEAKYQSNINVTVNEDADYVVVYAVKGDMVKYTVRYVTADTKTELATETVGYANKGFVVVGSKNIDGYLPQAYNLGLTIGDDESKNILTFEYSPIPPETEPQQGQPVQEPNANVEGDYNIEQIPQPAEFINLDEQEVPLANLDANKDRDWKALAKPLIIGGVILLIGLFALMILLDSKKKKEEKEV